VTQPPTHSFRPPPSTQTDRAVTAVAALAAARRGAIDHRRLRRGLGLAASLGVLVALAGCGQDNLARCVDTRAGTLVDVSRCDAEAADGAGGRYTWNFGGSGDTSPGSKVSGGEPVDPADQAAISQRGGFAPDAQTSGTAVREVGQGSEAEGKKKKSKSFGRRRR